MSLTPNPSGHFMSPQSQMHHCDSLTVIQMFITTVRYLERNLGDKITTQVTAALAVTSVHIGTQFHCYSYSCSCEAERSRGL